MATDFELITLEEFARRMGVSRSTVFSWLSKGLIKEGKLVIRIDKTIRFVWSLEALATLSRPEYGTEESPDFTNGTKVSQVNLDY